MLKILIGAISSLLIYSTAYGGNFRSYTEETTPVSTDIFLMQQADDSANNWITFGNMVSNYLDALYQSYDANMILWPSAIDATEISYLDNADTNLIAAIDLNTAKVTNTDNQDASEVATDTTNFDNNLSVADTTVQAALETIDELTTGGTVTWPTVAGIPYWTSGTAWGGAYTLVTTVGDPGSDTNIASEQAIREALDLKADASGVAYNMEGDSDNLLYDTADPFLDDTATDANHILSAAEIRSEHLSGTEIVLYGTFIDPDAVYQVTPSVTIMNLVPAAFTISELSIACDADPTTEITMTFNHKAAGVGYGTPTAIVTSGVSTTAGVVTHTTPWNDATIAAGVKLFITLSDPDDALLECAWQLEGSWD